MQYPFHLCSGCVPPTHVKLAELANHLRFGPGPQHLHASVDAERRPIRNGTCGAVSPSANKEKRPDWPGWGAAGGLPKELPEQRLATRFSRTPGVSPPAIDGGGWRQG